MCMYKYSALMCICTLFVSDTHRSQKMVLDPFKLKLEMIIIYYVSEGN